MTDERLIPYTWQQADIDRAARSITPQAGALIVSSPGAGKTVVATEILVELQPEVTLIIAPPSTHISAWARTLKRQGFADGVKPLLGTKPGRANFEALRWGEPGVYITSAQWFTRTDWAGIEFDAIIVDEIHMLAKHGNAGMKRLVGHGRKKGVTAPIRIGLSGTPFRNNFENAWTIAKWVEPSVVPLDFWVWRVTKCVGVYDHFAPQNLRVTGEREEGELASQLTCFIKHSQRERCCEFHPNGFLAHLAPPIRVNRDLAMTREQAEFYHDMENTYAAMLTTPNENGEIPVIAEFPIVARGMLRFCALALPSFNEETEKLYFEEDAPSPKLDESIADLRMLDGARVLAFTHSAQFAEVAAKRYQKAGFNSIAWTGGLSKTKRTQALADFLSGEIDVIVGVISAMGTGTDGLQEAAYNVFWLSVDDDPSNNVQGIGRLDRLGQQHQVTMFDYRMLKTYDVGHLDKQIQKQLDLNRSLIAKGEK